MFTALMTSLVLTAEPMRLVRLTVVDGSEVPVVFWRDGRLCLGDAVRAHCHDVHTHDEPTIVLTGQSKALAKTVKMSWKKSTVSIDNAGHALVDDHQTTVERLRCGLGRHHELVDFRFARGRDQELAVLSLEEDDTRSESAALDVVGFREHFRKEWFVLYAVDACPD